MKCIILTLSTVFLLLSPLDLLRAADLSKTAAEPSRQHNILVMFSDDHGYADLSCQGSTGVETPHIDSLAVNGVRCTAGYVTAPQCSPSRAGLVSGRYQQRFGHEDNHNKPVMLMNGGRTIGDQLKAAGYATGHFGKWHLGFETKESAPNEFVEKGDWMAPTQHGFDESFGFADLAKTMVVPGKKKQPKVGQDDRIFARKTADFIERHQDQPWCVYLAFHAPHQPHTKLPEYTSRYSDAPEDRQGLLAAMALLDDAVGIVLDKLRELGMEENTLIFFISDNGGQRFQGVNAKWKRGSENKPFRGGKGSGLEGGVRLPYLVQWKGQIPAGTTYDRPVISLDVIPTALAAACADPLADYELDGVNLLPFLRGERASDPHEVLFWRWRNEWAIRVGDWKLVKSITKHFGYQDWALIDLSSDLEERKDLTAEHPEIAKDLRQRWEKWNASLPPIGAEFNGDPTE